MMRRGAAYAAMAYTVWGLFPLYFHRIAAVPALEVLGHRVVWSLLFVLALLAWRRQGAALLAVAAQPHQLARFVVTAALMAANWLLFIWAVANGHVLEASLGYFINPLVNVLLGATFLHERLRRAQWVAVGLAALGVLWLGWLAGRPPWIALTLAFTFGTYGLLRKTAPLGALEGLTLETLLLLPFALGAGAWAFTAGHLAFTGADATTQAMLLLIGPLTAVPLLLFAAGARRIPLSLLGMLQYIGPSIQFLLGIWVFHEPFSPARGWGFALIWTACALFTADLALQAQRSRRGGAAAAPSPTGAAVAQPAPAVAAAAAGTLPGTAPRP
jgi:chloramphenicol-sensitive protein RarD